MSGTILIIDHLEENNFKERIEKSTNFSIIGHTSSIDTGFILAEKHQPEVILLNVDMPGGENESASESFALEFPASNLVLMTSSDSKRVLRQALRVGAKDVIVLPIEDDKLLHVVKKVVQAGVKRRNTYTVEKKQLPQFKTVTVFSTKGGVGKSTVALNLAISMQRVSKKRVALVDLNLASGNIALMAGINVKSSIKELIDDLTTQDIESPEDYLVKHSSGIWILPAPSNSEWATYIKTEYITKALEKLSQYFNYVIIDTPNYFQDSVFPAFDLSQNIVIVSNLDMASAQNVKQCMDLISKLNMRSKARLVINRSDFPGGLDVKDLEEELGMTAIAAIPNCEKQAVNSVNLGIPLVLADKSTILARRFEMMAKNLINDEPKYSASNKQRGIFAVR